MPNLAKFVGMRLSHVLVLEAVPKYHLICQCDCGKICRIQGNTFERSVKESRGISCGCAKKKLIALGQTHHGMTDSPEWKSWMSMKDRCLDPTHKSYADYGGRGITIYEPWITSFEAFYESLGPRPKGKTLDRLENNGNYEPGNCAWRTYKEQARNKRNNRFLEYGGLRLTVSEWAERTGIPRGTLDKRLDVWSVGDALTRPIRPMKKSGSFLLKSPGK